MLGFLWLETAWFELAEKIGGTGFLAICLGALVVWNAALMYFKLGAMEKALVEVRKNMVTRDGLALVLVEMEDRLKTWVGDRFQTKEQAEHDRDSNNRDWAAMLRNYLSDQR